MIATVIKSCPVQHKNINNLEICVLMIAKIVSKCSESTLIEFRCCFREEVMGVTDGAEIDDVTFDRSPQHGFSIRAATFPYLVRRSLHDFG